ncbi:hypothetical protein P355_0771 [Burkholderia cenocepacia KC-01]|nr:hypothetical protein P355_0771 [Burkholderia cenocepacia KC-01]
MTRFMKTIRITKFLKYESENKPPITIDKRSAAHDDFIASGRRPSL